MKTIIEIRQLYKTYLMGNEIVRALDGVDLNLIEGEITAITGPSGSGKSTLMHILGCLDTPDSGEYILGGENVAGFSTDRLASIRNKHIGFVFQSFNLLSKSTARENVELPLLYSGVKNPSSRAKEALDIVGLSNRMNHRPNEMSGGQRQRVAVARAIVTNPSIVLADEPTGNLDTETGAEILSLFKNLNDAGRTIIMVTHDPHVASHCRRQVHILDGKIKEDRQ